MRKASKPFLQMTQDGVGYHGKQGKQPQDEVEVKFAVPMAVDRWRE